MNRDLSRLRDHHRILLVLLFLAGLALRLWFLDGRWINPDEGAHLMDGRLAAEGLVPGIDYGARQALYVYVLAAFVGGGGGYETARLYALLASLVSAGFVYLIARRLLDRLTATLACALVLFLPFSVAYATHVKTEPLAAVLGCAAVYALVRGFETDSRRFHLVLSGALLGLAFYARESSLGVLLAALLVVTFRGLRSPGSVAKPLLRISSGYVAVVLVASALFAMREPVEQVWRRTDVNPVAFVVSNLADTRLGRKAPPEPIAAPGGLTPSGERETDQPWEVTLSNLAQTGSVNFLLLAGLVLSPLAFLPWSRPGRTRRGAIWILYAWVGCMGVGYAFWTLDRGFFPAYFVELVPPLAILTAMVVVEGWERLRDPRGENDLRIATGLLAVPVGVLALGLVGLPTLHRPLYFALAVGLLGALCLPVSTWGRRLAVVAIPLGIGLATVVIATLPPPPLRWLTYAAAAAATYGAVLATARVRFRGDLAIGFLALSALVSAAAVWVSDTGGAVDRRFDGVWSPEAVRAVSSVLRERGDAGDQVMSGAVIWEFEAGLRPFGLRSHPLSLRLPGPRDRADPIRAQFEAAPPRFVVLDGYTEQSYGRLLPDLESAVERRYTMRLEVADGVRHRVRVYELTEAPSAASASRSP